MLSYIGNFFFSSRSYVTQMHDMQETPSDMISPIQVIYRNDPGMSNNVAANIRLNNVAYYSPVQATPQANLEAKPSSVDLSPRV